MLPPNWLTKQLEAEHRIRAAFPPMLVEAMAGKVGVNLFQQLENHDQSPDARTEGR